MMHLYMLIITAAISRHFFFIKCKDKNKRIPEVQFRDFLEFGGDKEKADDTLKIWVLGNRKTRKAV